MSRHLHAQARGHQSPSTMGKPAGAGTRIPGTIRSADGLWWMLLLLPSIVGLAAIAPTEAAAASSAAAAVPVPRPVASVCSSWSISPDSKACGSRASRFRLDYPIVAGDDTVAVEVLEAGCDRAHPAPPVRVGRVTVSPERGTASVEFLAPSGILPDGPTVDFCLRATVSGGVSRGERRGGTAAAVLPPGSPAAPLRYRTENNVSATIAVRCRNDRFRRCQENEGLGALYAVVESISLEGAADPHGGAASKPRDVPKPLRILSM